LCQHHGVFALEFKAMPPFKPGGFGNGSRSLLATGRFRVGIEIPNASHISEVDVTSSLVSLFMPLF
jgi:hypothetical protein